MKSAYDAVTYLINKGYKKIAHFAGPQSLDIFRKRWKGYKKAILNAGLPYKENLVIFGGVTEKDGYVALDKLFQQEIIPDAIFTIDDVAIGAYKKIKEMGLKIPDDIAVVGFSNARISSIVHPALTTVSQPSYEMGIKASEILIGLIQKGKNSAKPITVTLKTEFLIREST